MASRLIVLRQRVAAAFRSAIVTYGKEVTPELSERTKSFLDDGATAVDGRTADLWRTGALSGHPGTAPSSCSARLGSSSPRRCR